METEDTSKPLHSRLITIASGVVFLGLVFMHSALPIKTVTDFWWHLTTGRYIVEQGSLPDEDPFAFTTAPGASVRKSVVLKGYWAAQVAYYKLYQMAGFRGVIIARALIFTFLFWLAFRAAQSRGLTGPVGLLWLAPAMFIAGEFVDDRPQVFSFIGAVAYFYFIERGLARLRTGRRLGPLWFALPGMMALWANVHPGAVVGIGMGLIYLCAEGVRHFLKRPGALERHALGHLGIWIGASIAASALSPVHVLPLLSWRVDEATASFFKTITEYLPPDKYYAEIGSPGLVYLLYGALAVPALLMAIDYKRLEISHAVMFAVFCAAGLASFRFVMFAALMAAVLSAGALANLIRPHRESLARAGFVVIMALAIVTGVGAWRASAFSKGDLRDDLPVQTADFIEGNAIEGKIFNPYEWGGYLMWRLYPKHKVFIDPRTLDAAAYEDYMEASMRTKTAVFYKHGVKAVAFYYLDPMGEKTPSIIFSLLRDMNWRLVHLDEQSAIFVEESVAGNMRPVNRGHLVNGLMNIANALVEKNPTDPLPYVMLGQIHLVRGSTPMARVNFAKALSMDPTNKVAQQWMQYINLYRE